jgi:N-hydroxyarylamine O-acetyltransferase
MMNHYTATHPDSPFVSGLVALRATPTHRHVLRGGKLATVRPDGTQDVRDVTADVLDVTLRRAFGINLKPAEVARLKQYV